MHPLFGPTREENFEGIYIHRISEGKIVEEWSQANTLHTTLERHERETRGRERVEQELRVARRIQQALLPQAIPQLNGWRIVQHYQPAREVGGDFYDFLLLADGYVGLVIGDVSGKGVPAAVLMANAQSVLRTIAQRGGSEPGHMLAEANEVLCTYVPPNMFVTCFYSVLDPKSGHFNYANTGHNLPRCLHEVAASELRARGMRLRLMAGMFYEEKETVLLPGDGVLFYTDGLVEAHDPKGELFGSSRLRSLVAKHLYDVG